MAKMLREFIVEVDGSYIKVYYDGDISEIRRIDGIKNILDFRRQSPFFCLSIFVDPRYDIHEIKQEIHDLLSAKIPNVFLEER